MNTLTRSSRWWPDCHIWSIRGIMKVTQRTLSKCSVTLNKCVTPCDAVCGSFLLWASILWLCSAFYQGHDSGGECNVPYINRFAMPRPGSNQPWWVEWFYQPFAGIKNPWLKFNKVWVWLWLYPRCDDEYWTWLPEHFNTMGFPQ